MLKGQPSMVFSGAAAKPILDNRGSEGRSPAPVASDVQAALVVFLHGVEDDVRHHAEGTAFVGVLWGCWAWPGIPVGFSVWHALGCVVVLELLVDDVSAQACGLSGSTAGFCICPML